MLSFSGSKIHTTVKSASILKEIHSLAVRVLASHIYYSQKLYMHTVNVFLPTQNSFEFKGSLSLASAMPIGCVHMLMKAAAAYAICLAKAAFLNAENVGQGLKMIRRRTPFV